MDISLSFDLNNKYFVSTEEIRNMSQQEIKRYMKKYSKEIRYYCDKIDDSVINDQFNYEYFINISIHAVFAKFYNRLNSFLAKQKRNAVPILSRWHCTTTTNSIVELPNVSVANEHCAVNKDIAKHYYFITSYYIAKHQRSICEEYNEDLQSMHHQYKQISELVNRLQDKYQYFKNKASEFMSEQDSEIDFELLSLKSYNKAQDIAFDCDVFIE